MSELIDVLDQHGNYTGKVATRKEVHEKGLWAKAVALFILDKTHTKVLLQKRAANKYPWPGCWDVSAGGHVHAGEFGFETAVRETKEEIGLDFKPNDFICIGSVISSNVKGDFKTNFFNEFYVVEKDDLDPTKLTLQEEEVESAKWFTLDELKDMFKNHYDELADKTGCWEYIIRYMESRQ